MKKLLFVACVVLVMVSCNKNQKAVKKLGGTWLVTKYEITDNNETKDYIPLLKEMKLTFDNCKLKDNEYCIISSKEVALNGDVEEDSDVYTVKQDGTVLEIGIDSNASTIKITELTKTNCVLDWTEDSLIAHIEMKKQ